MLWKRPRPQRSARGRRHVLSSMWPHRGSRLMQASWIFYTQCIKVLSAWLSYVLSCSVSYFALGVSSWWIRDRMTLPQTGRQITLSNTHPWSVTMSQSLVTTLCLSLFLSLSFTRPVTRSFVHMVVLSKLSPSTLFLSQAYWVRHRIHNRIFICLCLHFISVSVFSLHPFQKLKSRLHCGVRDTVYGNVHQAWQHVYLP